MSNDNQLTVAELIEKLIEMPKNALVDIEGCDCYGEACSVSCNKKLNTVSIER